ncbi:MAG: hypothetical protein VXZ53_13925, partial [Planctomycetota bacterium]|nr:hypothetical protein [Planctomycetota bacterium]
MLSKSEWVLGADFWSRRILRGQLSAAVAVKDFPSIRTACPHASGHKGFVFSISDDGDLKWL